LSKWKIIFDKISQHAHHLKITGGEPTLYPEFKEFTSTIEQLNIPFTLFTNGRWNNPEYVVSMLKSNQMFSGALVSLHGSTAFAHEAFTGTPGSFIETVNNIRLATSRGLPINLSCVLSKHNAGQVKNILSLGKELGVKAIVFNRYIGQPIQDLRLTSPELKHLVKIIGNLIQSGEPVRFGNCIPQCFVPSSATGCLSGAAYCTISPQGELRPCNHVSWRAGSLISEPLEAVWYSEIMQSWRNLISDTCKQCPDFSQCRGGCRAEAILNSETQDPLMSVRRSFATHLLETELVF
jgi:radical SAM protein with 4Fe4S-binding SPASM domain